MGQFGDQGAQDRIEKLSLYKQSHGKEYKSDYATILAWEHRLFKTNIPKKNEHTFRDPDKYIRGKYGHMVQR